MSGIQPISYEDELIQRRTEIVRDPLRDMLLFPDDDITVSYLIIFLRSHSAGVIKISIINTYCMKQPDLYYFEAIKMTL